MLIAAAMVCVFTPMVGADPDQKDITVTLTPGGTATIAITPNTWDPEVSIGGNLATSTTHFNLTSVGTVSVNVSATCANSTSDEWKVASTPGHNQFNMSIYATETGEDWALLSWDSPQDVVKELPVAAGGTHWSLFGLKVYMPTSSDTNDPQTVIITFTATIA